MKEVLKMKALTLVRTVIRAAFLTVCIPALALPALAAAPAAGQLAGEASPSEHSTQAVPAALRPVLYRALARDADPALRIGSDGCMTQPRQALKACFDGNGAHFSSPGAEPLALHLVAYGRDEEMIPLAFVRPTFHGNHVSYVHGTLTEWWRALPMGFEQGFTLEKRPLGHGELMLKLVAKARPSKHKGTLVWGKLRYGGLVVTDAEGKVIPASLKSKDGHILITVNDAHAVYPLRVDPLVWLKQKVTSSDGASGDMFGFSVAISDRTALIGAWFANVEGQAQRGAVYVFTESNGTWEQVQKLTAENGVAGDAFGASLALDGTTALIGAPGAGLQGQGAVYVFAESTGTWSQAQELSESNGTEGDAFGRSVALDDTTAIVGTGQTIDGIYDQGAAYVFKDTNGAWVQTQELTSNDTGNYGYNFGTAISLEGSTALIGASYASSGGIYYTGAVYVFTESEGVWDQTQKLNASMGVINANFGQSVALVGAKALVGAPYDVYFGIPTGAVYTFVESNGAWIQTQKLVPSDGMSGDHFGWDLALAGDGTTALIGTATTTGQGTAYIFGYSNGIWVQLQKLAPNMAVSSVALNDANILVATPGATVGGHPAQGAVYFYRKGNLGLALSVPEAVGQGQTYVSQTIATNNASAASPAVSATIAVPAAVSFVSANATQGSCSGEDSGVVTCDFGQIGGNAGTATANVTLKAIGDPGTTIENTAGIAKATPALTGSAATEITSPGGCAAGYTEFSGHLDAGETFTSAPIEVTEAGQKYVDLTAPASFAFFAITTTRYGQHTYVYPHAKHGHRWGAAGTYQVGVQAGPDAGGDYTLCVNLNPAQ